MFHKLSFKNVNRLQLVHMLISVSSVCWRDGTTGTDFVTCFKVAVGCYYLLCCGNSVL